MLRLAIDLISDHERVLAEAGDVLIYPLQQVLQHHRMRWVGPVITGALADYVHRPSDHTDILAGHRLDDVVECADPSTHRHVTPCPFGVEDLMPVKLYARVQAVSRGSRS